MTVIVEHREILPLGFEARARSRQPYCKPSWRFHFAVA
jgi:hypothetical protein